MNKIALITGATSGIGRATAEQFAGHGFDLVLCGRRAERLQALQTQLSEHVRVHTLQFDVRDREAVQEALASIPDEFRPIDILINNAGNAFGLDPVQSASVDDWDAMIDSNVKGLLYVSEPIIKSMVARRAGHIINLGSTAGKEVYPKGSVYCASKHAVDALTKGMRMDLNPFGIKVASINPGAVETEFSNIRFKGDQAQADKVYEGYEPLHAEDIADIILFMVTRPLHVNVADVIVMPRAQASALVLNRNEKTQGA
ncbi:NADP-dependent 3-hydroxy acid dehydrogenase YdfG [Catalinimonas alkaloidigena]|uniref:NADP-dependent 3-hydroxy acid dehydrogenase YdfG n=1 Tax=Catalinimonas alkaloidigena TaxID=1075417 RepID=A0A1G8WKM9_9BACT|nr:SDR family NAD(P)-dependent oxidoreductase [Catalinimonas alkaloidigena]SDJ78912.1 NADP-dependent 3-hydroxy acid dehydrogenase YdfG [Catalinimonas alkaloidigena]